MIASAPLDPARERYVSLATFRRDGREVRTPVWIAGTAPRYYVFTEPNVGKVKRIRANGRASLASCTMRGQVTGPWTAARARIVDDPATIAVAYTALRSKYGFAMWFADTLSKLSGRYAKRVMLEIEIAAA